MSILSNSTSALLSFQRALQTISHNVANANTPGFSRQRVELSNRAGAPSGNGFAGAGVQVDTIRRLQDSFAVGRLLVSGAELGRLADLSLLSNRVDAAFTDPGTSITASWSRFFDSAQAISVDPSSTSAREAYLASAETLAARFRYLDGQLDSLEIETNQRIQTAAEDVTRLAAEVGRLNQEIVRNQAAAGGQPPNDLLDQRDLTISRLNELIGVTTVAQDDGSLNVFTSGGQALVVGNRSLTLTTVQDPFQPQRVNVALQFVGGTSVLPDSALGGRLGGLTDFRRDVLDPTNRSLGQLATTVAFLVNEANAQGVDLYGNPGNPIFNQPAISPLAGLNNTGTATLSASIANIGGIAENDIELNFDGVSWTARDPATSQPLPISGTGTALDPFIVNGVALVLGGGAANAGDSFLVRPTAGAAGLLTVAMTDPRQVAAAAPVQVSANVANIGNSVPQLSVVDRNDPGLGLPIDIVFVDPNNYTVNGGPPIPWVPGDVIAVNGWELRLDPPPETGDTFSVRATQANSGDNTNARALAQVDDALRLFGGTGSLNTTLREMVSAVGASAQSAQFSLDAQSAINDQLVQDRESVSGVNLDEEASNMLKFQQAYQAAAKMIGTADTVFQSLLAAVQR
ncbi:flagellar hook-associated protein FlgK [Pseudomarimonas arenosa]|uniref:Flagellar hook-associated protein 1 n=1 Tax=Pseudomarimonas arenosa TaxID=2774145 RepID=A0AAW3ZHM0_9GAMM|nr:flagellar hook-associated protein FlgK [Pseudomarimonas arenosa]MBD8524754.1 flagellar hook-associated protein FlgK [Pseudomarimonas arenosa]